MTEPEVKMQSESLGMSFWTNFSDNSLRRILTRSITTEGNKNAEFTSLVPSINQKQNSLAELVIRITTTSL